MKSFHIKSIMIGIGIGAILAAIISMIYTAGNSKLTNQEIIEQAKNLGMIEASSIFDENTSQDEKIIDSSSITPTNSMAPIATASPKPQSNLDVQQKQPDVKIKIVVARGDSSESVGQKLAQAKLIADKKVFIDEVTKMGLSMEINIGEYVIKKGTDIKAIIKLLTTSN